MFFFLFDIHSIHLQVTAIRPILFQLSTTTFLYFFVTFLLSFFFFFYLNKPKVVLAAGRAGPHGMPPRPVARHAGRASAGAGHCQGPWPDGDGDG